MKIRKNFHTYFLLFFQQYFFQEDIFQEHKKIWRQSYQSLKQHWKFVGSKILSRKDDETKTDRHTADNQPKCTASIVSTSALYVVNATPIS